MCRNKLKADGHFVSKRVYCGQSAYVIGVVFKLVYSTLPHRLFSAVSKGVAVAAAAEMMDVALSS